MRVLRVWDCLRCGDIQVVVVVSGRQGHLGKTLLPKWAAGSSAESHQQGLLQKHKGSRVFCRIPCILLLNSTLESI